jgi:hypothetical protein
MASLCERGPAPAYVNREIIGANIPSRLTPSPSLAHDSLHPSSCYWTLEFKNKVLCVLRGGLMARPAHCCNKADVVADTNYRAG